jgi:hypothetical protein
MIKQGITFLFLLATLASFGQTINLRDNVDCYGTTVQTISRTSSSGTPSRNIFTGTLNFSGSPEPNRVIWTGSRWEIQTSPDGGSSWDLVYSNTYASHPNPPRLGTGTWVADPALNCGTLAQFNGDGTQTSITLPVELMSFDAQNTTEGKTHLTWATASEHNNEGFEIEKSTDGTRFEKIGFVAGAGNSNQKKEYAFEDASAFERSVQVVYYRLRQVDHDGAFEYSKIVSVKNIPGNTSIKIYPTTTTGLLTVEAEGASVDLVTVLNQVGKVVLTAQKVSRVDMSALPAGLYHVQVQAGQEQLTERVFKQ